MSLDEPELVDSALTFPSGYDTLEYSWVKATAVSVRLRILFVMLQSTNSNLSSEQSNHNFVEKQSRVLKHYETRAYSNP